jgi:hypothetical protein
MESQGGTNSKWGKIKTDAQGASTNVQERGRGVILKEAR